MNKHLFVSDGMFHTHVLFGLCTRTVPAYVCKHNCAKIFKKGEWFIPVHRSSRRDDKDQFKRKPKRSVYF